MGRDSHLTRCTNESRCQGHIQTSASSFAFQNRIDFYGSRGFVCHIGLSRIARAVLMMALALLSKRHLCFS